jgi:hypothetical protein
MPDPDTRALSDTGSAVPMVLLRIVEAQEIWSSAAVQTVAT